MLRIVSTRNTPARMAIDIPWGFAALEGDPLVARLAITKYH